VWNNWILGPLVEERNGSEMREVGGRIKIKDRGSLKKAQINGPTKDAGRENSGDHQAR